MIWFITNVDTELLALRTALEALPDGFDAVRAAQPVDTSTTAGPGPRRRAVPCSSGCCGGRRAWEAGVRRPAPACVGAGHPVPRLRRRGRARRRAHRASTVPSGTVTEAFALPRATAGRRTSRTCLRFVADTVLLEGFGFDPPGGDPDPRRLAGDARRARPTGRWSASSSTGPTSWPGTPSSSTTCATRSRRAGADALARLVLLAAGRRRAGRVLDAAARARARRRDHHRAGDRRVGRRRGHRRRRRRARRRRRGTPARSPRSTCPIIQAPSSGRSRAEWLDDRRRPRPVRRHRRASPSPSSTGASSARLRVQRGGRRRRRARHRRCGPTAPCPTASPGSPGSRVRHARLRRTPAGRAAGRDRAVAPTRPSAAGSATPSASTRRRRPSRLLDALRDAGYRVDRIPADGDALMAELADGLTYDAESLTAGAARRGRRRASTSRDYAAWFADAARRRPRRARAALGPGAGHAHRVHDGELVFSGVDLGNVLVAIQPPRGYGDDPVAIVPLAQPAARPPLPRLLPLARRGAGAPTPSSTSASTARSSGCRARRWRCRPACWPDAALGDVPFFYPFVVNDPGEGTQAKRRAHAVVIDHLLPPMTRADTYDELAQLEQLLRRVRPVQSLDPAKLPALREPDLGAARRGRRSTATSASTTRPTTTASTT